MADERIYTHMSGKAVKGLTRLVRNRDVYVKPSAHGYTVVTKSGKNGRNERTEREPVSV